MIRTGDTIENTATGERLTFLATSADTDGEAVVVETLVQPGGAVAAAHVHPAQSERFAVAEGTLALKVGREQLTLGPGEVAIVEAGTAHKFWNAGDEPVRFVCEIRPALQFESLVETMFALAADGKTNRKGMPMNPFRLAVIAKAHSTPSASRSRRPGCRQPGSRSARLLAACSATRRRTSRSRPSQPGPPSRSSSRSAGTGTRRVPVPIGRGRRTRSAPAGRQGARRARSYPSGSRRGRPGR